METPEILEAMEEVVVEEEAEVEEEPHQ